MLLFSILPTMRTISSTMNPVLRPIVVCGPSGSGKSTLLRRLIDEFQDYLGFTVSHTTRKPRDGELNGREYHFIEREEMLKAVAEGEFIEHAEFSGNIYGTSKRAMEDVQKAGKICVLDLEIEGVRNMKKLKHLNPLFIFIKAPSLEVLAQRLRDRGTDSEESISKRLKRAEVDLNIDGIETFFDLIIVNDDRDRAYQALRSYIEPMIEAAKVARKLEKA
ncbi:guanylate kinase-like isoform X3 [Brevipalpus obovatus]|uniref:guanylate kinase-like isoform X3 n=2 Tax=Brevipalpus obovatus TaxID=246614 RepID=UPI003D9EDD2A